MWLDTRWVPISHGNGSGAIGLRGASTDAWHTAGVNQTPGARGTRIERLVGTIVQRAVGVALVLTVALVLVRPHDPNIDYRTGWVLVGLVAGLVVAVAAGSVLARRKDRPGARGARERAAWGGAVAVSLAGGVAGVLLALPLRYAYGWDAAVVTGFSRQASAGSVSAYAIDYLSRYPNNLALVALMNLARDLGGSSDRGMYDAFIVANGVSLAVVLLLTFVLVRMLRGVTAAFVAQAAVFVLVGCSPWMAVPYTDFPAMPFVIGAVTLAVAACRPGRRTARTVMAVAAFVLIAVAFVIKSTPASTAVAFGLVGVVALVGGGSRRARLRTLGVVVAGAAAFGLTSLGSLALTDDAAQVPRQQLDTSRTAPVTWWLANGLTATRSISGRPYYGAYSPEMVRDSMDLRGDTLQTWSDHRLQRQLSSLGASGVAAFEVRKLTFNWGDGMFFAWGEGYDYQAKRLTEHGQTARAIQSWQHVSGAHYLLRASLTNGLWLALLAWAGVGLIRSRYRRELLVLVLSVLGIAVFTLVFQGRSRYLFAYVPVVIALAAAAEPIRWRPAGSRNPVSR